MFSKMHSADVTLIVGFAGLASWSSLLFFILSH